MRTRRAIVSDVSPTLRDRPSAPSRPHGQKAVPTLPAGPYQVPISTIDWLVSRENPAARYVALRDLMARPPKDIELRKAKQALPRDLFVRDTLAVLKRKLSPDQSAADLAKKYDGGLWLTLVLLQIGCDRTMPEIQRAGDVLFSRWERTFRAIERTDPPVIDLPVFSTVCRTLALIGYGEDPRVLGGADHLARRRIGGGSQADAGLVTKDLLLFSAIPEVQRSEVVRRAITFSVERAIGTELGAAPSPGSPESYGFPAGDGPDRLELLNTLAGLGVPLRPEITAALSLVVSRADRRGRWALGPGLNDGLPVALERTGELSRWVTIRALRVMQHYLGLTVAGKP
jgi:hypothetical protein